MAQILVFGDSITYGAWDKEGGWVQRLKKDFDEKNLMGDGFYCLVYNLGIDGDTTDGILHRLEFEAKQRMLEGETIFVFNIGANDSRLVRSLNDSMIPAEKFKENVKKMIETAKKFSSKIIFVGLSPVDESKTDAIPWMLDMYYKNEFIKKYDGITASICQESEVGFVETFRQFEKSDFKLLLKDGLHPNSEGHKLIFETVRDFLADKKII